jgi:hypothetical protein
MRASIFLMLMITPVTVSSDRPLSVCEVLSNPATYRGKIVSIRGAWITGPEQNYLGPYECAFKDKRPINDESAGIYLQVDQNPANESVADRESHRQADAVARARRRTAPSAIILMTVTGRFESRDSFIKGLTVWRRRQEAGYGHLGLWPTQLVYTRLSDIVMHSK